jgi:hypothetical protein
LSHLQNASREQGELPTIDTTRDRTWAICLGLHGPRSCVVGFSPHQIVQVGDFRGGHGGEWNGDLAAMHGGCGEHATDRDLAVGGVDVQLVADPGYLMSIRIALGADIAIPRQIVQHRG